MALHHAVIFFSLIYIWLLVASAHSRRDPRPQTRGSRPTRGLDKYLMELSTARGYGKRAVDMNIPANKYFLELIALESKLRRLGIPRNIPRTDTMLLE